LKPELWFQTLVLAKDKVTQCEGAFARVFECERGLYTYNQGRRHAFRPQWTNIFGGNSAPSVDNFF